MRIIGLTGPAGCGKDTVARFLCDTQGFVQIAFADPIRDGLKAMFGLGDYQLSDPVQKEKAILLIGKSPRELMQTLGTEWGRNLINPDLWIHLAWSRIIRLGLASQNLHIGGVVISDVRHEKEAAFVRERGRLWHIYRPDGYSTLVAKTAMHSSELGVGVKPGDQIIRNNGSIEDLHETIAQLFPTEEAS
jgi:hypothetical protein